MRHFELSGHFTGNPNFTSPGQETQEKIWDCKATVLEFKAILSLQLSLFVCTYEVLLPCFLPASSVSLQIVFLASYCVTPKEWATERKQQPKKFQTIVTLKSQPKLQWFLFYYQTYLKISQSDTIPKFDLDSVPVVAHCYGCCAILSLGRPQLRKFPCEHSLPSPLSAFQSQPSSLPQSWAFEAQGSGSMAQYTSGFFQLYSHWGKSTLK